MNSDSYLYELDYIRGWAILGVVLIHIAGQALSMELAKSVFAFAAFAGQVSRFSVPAFLFVSGILLGHRHSARPVTWNGHKDFLARRVQQIIVPYAVWTTLALVQAGPLSVSDLIGTVFFGKGLYYQLYFVPLIFQFYLLAPVFIQVARHWVSLNLVIAINLGAAALYQSTLLAGIRLPRLDGNFDLYLQSCLIMWMMYPVLGCVVGLRYNTWRKRLSSLGSGNFIALFAISLAAVVLDIWHSYSAGHNISGPLSGFFRPAVQVYSLSVMALLLHLTSRAIDPKKSVVSLIGRFSFSIYLVHLMILKLLTSLAGPGWLSTISGIAAALLLCIGGSLLVSVILARLPYGWVLVGRTTQAKYALNH